MERTTGQAAVVLTVVLAVATVSADLLRADSGGLREQLLGPFQGERSSVHSRERTRALLRREFQSLGLDVWYHNFSASELAEVGRVDGVNVVARIPGSLPSAQTLLFGAHYDTVEDTNGVNDNGSGMSALLELAKIFVNSQCSFNHTILFVAFDLEEVGCLGSYHLINGFLTEDIKNNFLGAYILDTVLNYNESENSQEIPKDFRTSLPMMMRSIEEEGSRGNFLSLIAREQEDRHLARALQSAWKQNSATSPSKLHTMAIPIGAEIPDAKSLLKHFNFLRSDHAIFWFNQPVSLRAVLISDLGSSSDDDEGPFRGVMKSCYHNPCDDGRMVTSDNLRQLCKLIDSVAEAALDLAEGSCTLDMTLAALKESSGPELVPGFLLTILPVLLATCWT